MKVNGIYFIKGAISKLYAKLKYFGDNSNLQGVKYVFSTSHVPSFKRFFWLFILICCCLGAAAILHGSLSLFFDEAVSYTVETNFLDWNTPFPAITVCEQLDNDRFKEYTTRKNMPTGLANFYKEVTFWNNKYCKTCTNCAMNKTCFENFQQFITDYRLKCPEFLQDCWWNGKPFACCERFRSLETEYGICFTFNSRMNNTNIEFVNRKTDLPNITFFVLQKSFVRVHAPEDTVSVALENILGQSSNLGLVTDFQASIKGEQTISDASIQAITPNLRGCLLKHEKPEFANLWQYSNFTNSACVMYCRTHAQAEICNCTHHFMPKLHGVSVCNISGLACLYTHKDSVVSVLECGCPVACEEIHYKLLHQIYFRYDTLTAQKLLSRGSRVQINFAQLPALRVKRQAIRTVLQLVVDVGGVGGVFFGGSLLSVIEIIYLFFIRARQ